LKDEILTYRVKIKIKKCPNLEKINKSAVIQQPFPHFCIDDLLDDGNANFTVTFSSTT
jgi:hypothetical protein